MCLLLKKVQKIQQNTLIWVVVKKANGMNVLSAIGSFQQSLLAVRKL
jgi:hypothetical protein